MMKKRIWILALLLILPLLAACSGGTEKSQSPMAPEAPGMVEPGDSPQPGGVETPLAPEAPGDAEPEDRSIALDALFPFEHNLRAVYRGTGNEYAGFVQHVEYQEGDRMQRRVDNGGTAVVEVLERTAETVTMVYRQGEVYYVENFMARTDNRKEILLKAPIQVGSTWESMPGTQRTITHLDAPVETPYGDFEAVEVAALTTEQDGKETLLREYYVEGIGLVKRIYDFDGFQILEELQTLERDTPMKVLMNFYYPNPEDDRLFLYRKHIEFHTNDIMRNRILDAYRQVPEGVAKVFSENTKVNYMYLNQDGRAYIDVSPEFIQEMNAGAMYESLILQSLTNTLGDYFGTTLVMLTVEGKPYESGHILLGRFEALETNYNGIVDMN